MSLEALRQVLKEADASAAALFGADETRAWPERSLETLIALGLLREDAPATSIVCPGCDMQCLREVEIIGAGDETLAVIYCDQREDMEPIDIPLDSLRRWSVDVGQLANSLSMLLGGPGQAEERARGRLWSLGRVAAGEMHGDVFLARGSEWDDAIAAFAHPEAFRGARVSVVLTLSDAPADEAFAGRAEVAPLSQVLSIKDGDLKVAKRAITSAIRRAQRRLRVSRPGPDATLAVVLSIKQETQQAHLHGKELSLSVQLFRLLVLLAQRATERAGGWVPRKDIDDVLWPPVPGRARMYLPKVSDPISELRSAFNAVEPGSGKQFIITKRGGGYRLRLNPLEIELS